MARSKDIRLYVVAFKELIDEVVSQMDRETALRYIVDEVLPRVKEFSPPDEYKEIKTCAEEKLGIKLPV